MKIAKLKTLVMRGRTRQIGYMLYIYFYIRQFIDFEPQYPEDPDITRTYPSNVDQIMILSVTAADQIRIRSAEYYNHCLPGKARTTICTVPI